MAKKNEQRESDRQKINTWSSFAQHLNTSSKLEIFSPVNLAIKEMLQGGVVEKGGQDCLIRIYEDEQGRKHLLVANSAEMAANITQMLDYNDSQGENVSNCNGIGLKSSLSFFSNDEKTRGKFKIVTRDPETGEITYKESPYGENMPLKTEKGDWALDEKYTTYIDTVIDNYDILEKDLQADRLAETMGALFGFRIIGNEEKGWEPLNLRIETQDKVIERVEPNLPTLLTGKETFYKRNADTSKDDPELTVNHQQSMTIEREQNGEIKHLDITLQNSVSEEKEGVWRKRTASQGAYLTQDGIIQTHIGTRIMGVTEHPSMNGMHTFIDISSKDGGNLIYENEKAFDVSKTTLVGTSTLYKTIKKEVFDTPEQGRSSKDTYYKDGNSDQGWYRHKKESDTEKEFRRHHDLIYRAMCADDKDRRYATEFVDGQGDKYDGAILRIVSGTSYKDQPEEVQERYKHRAMPNERVEAIIEYKKSPMTKDDVSQILKYLKAQTAIGNIPRHCILCGPTIRKDALEFLKQNIADSPQLYGIIALRFTNERFDRVHAEDEEPEYSEEMLRDELIDEQTFNHINDTSVLWFNKGYEKRNDEIFKDEDKIFGSAHTGAIFAKDIQRYKEQKEALEMSFEQKDWGEIPSIPERIKAAEKEIKKDNDKKEKSKSPSRKNDSPER